MVDCRTISGAWSSLPKRRPIRFRVFSTTINVWVFVQILWFRTNMVYFWLSVSPLAFGQRFNLFIWSLHINRWEHQFDVKNEILQKMTCDCSFCSHYIGISSRARNNFSNKCHDKWEKKSSLLSVMSHHLISVRIQSFSVFILFIYVISWRVSTRRNEVWKISKVTFNSIPNFIWMTSRQWQRFFGGCVNDFETISLTISSF